MIKRIKSFENNAVCYLVATPIGNLLDISYRAIEILKSVSIIGSEDTRNTLKLLRHYSINTPLISYHEHNEQSCSEKLLSYLNNNQSIAIVSDAGYPGISDPGEIIVKHCIKHNIPVSIIPGGNAFLPALIGSGISTKHFYFHGFLEPKSVSRKKELEKLKLYPMTLIFYESPHRIKETISDLKEVFGNRQICLVREITKIHEEYIYGNIDELDSLDETTLKGEMVIVVEGNTLSKTYSNEELQDKFNLLLEQGITKKEALKRLIEETNLKKNYLYDLLMKD